VDSDGMAFLAQLSEAFGPSGFERPVARMVKERVLPCVDSVGNDKLGSIVFQKGSSGPRVLIAGHMDEIGFLVTGITKEGFINFTTLGYWFDQSLLAKQVRIAGSKGEVPGVISSKPPHVLRKEEMDKPFERKDMFIDVGANSEAEVKDLGIRLGDAAVPISSFSTRAVKRHKDDGWGERTLVFGKAFDDRIGVFIAAELMRRLHEERIDHPNVVIGACTVQEEVGLRGARTVAALTSPDVAFVVDVDDSGDLPGLGKDKASVSMGEGVGISTYSPYMIPNLKLKELVIDVAVRNAIPHQIGHVYGGGTDAGMIHLNDVGCPTIFLSIPTRHIHSHVGILDLKDVEAAIDLLVELVGMLDGDTVDSLVSFDGQ
jgi:putative aminopeptidase FrvX